MDVRVVQGAIQSLDADAVIVNLFQGVTVPEGATGAVDAALGGQIADVVAAGDFRRWARRSRCTAGGHCPRGGWSWSGWARRRRSGWRRCGAPRRPRSRRRAIWAPRRWRASSTARASANWTPRTPPRRPWRAHSLRSTTSGRTRAGRSPTRTTSAARSKRSPSSSTTRRGWRRCSARPRSVGPWRRAWSTRDLANHPSNVATPTYLAERAAQIAEMHGMRVEVWDRARIVGEGMGALLAVVAEAPRSRGSFDVASGRHPGAPTLGLVGKGVTFDSGGSR